MFNMVAATPRRHADATAARGRAASAKADRLATRNTTDPARWGAPRGGPPAARTGSAARPTRSTAACRRTAPRPPTSLLATGQQPAPTSSRPPGAVSRSDRTHRHQELEPGGRGEEERPHEVGEAVALDARPRPRTAVWRPARSRSTPPRTGRPPTSRAGRGSHQIDRWRPASEVVEPSGLLLGHGATATGCTEKMAMASRRSSVGGRPDRGSRPGAPGSAGRRCQSRCR